MEATVVPKSVNQEKEENLIFSGKKILTVDDSPACLLLLKAYLEKTGIDISSKNNGLEGFQEYEKNQFDLIILDLVMPRMSGFQVLDKIRQVDKKTPIIIVTASMPIGESEETQLKEAGADYVMMKPVKLDKLLGVMATLMQLEKTETKN